MKNEKGPSFLHFSPGHLMLCAVILMCIFSLVHQREAEAEENNTSSIPAANHLTVPGNCS